MKRKVLKVVDVDATYNDALEVVDEDVGEGETVEPESSEPVEEGPDDTIAPETEAPAESETHKKEPAKGTCDGCGKTMTMKNLRYAHKLVCPALNPLPETEVIEMSDDENGVIELISDEDGPPMVKVTTRVAPKPKRVSKPAVGKESESCTVTEN